MKLIRTTIAAAVAVASALPLAANAGSSFATGTGTLNTTVPMTFNVVIPRFVFLRVGDIAPATNNTLVYSPTVTEIVNSTAVQATGGDTGTGNSNVTVQVLSNAGGVTLAASNLANLNSSGNLIPTSTLTASNPTGTIAPPAFNGSTVIPAVGGVVNQIGSWRYTWANPAATVYPSGTYTGTVTYTATSP